MEGSRNVPNYDLQVSFSNTPQAIQEMGFVQFEENQVLSFLAPSQSQSSQLSQPLNGGGSGSSSTVAPVPTTANTAATTIGFSHGDLIARTSWNNEQVV